MAFVAVVFLCGDLPLGRAVAAMKGLAMTSGYASERPIQAVTGGAATPTNQLCGKKVKSA